MPSTLQLINKFVHHLNVIFDTFNICVINVAQVQVQKKCLLFASHLLELRFRLCKSEGGA
jgi:hypothetical protein